jgi:hypothetical protein
MPTNAASSGMTAAARLPVLASDTTATRAGAVATRAGAVRAGAGAPGTVLAEVRSISSVDPAIAQVRKGHFLLVNELAVLGTAGRRHRLLADVLSGGRPGNGRAERGGQIRP